MKGKERNVRKDTQEYNYRRYTEVRNSLNRRNIDAGKAREISIK